MMDAAEPHIGLYVMTAMKQGSNGALRLFLIAVKNAAQGSLSESIILRGSITAEEKRSHTMD
jgi:hypothetical protein